MPSSDDSSTWDFTAVIDLLHTPTRPESTNQSLVPAAPSADVSQHNPGEQGLGDFTALWDFLHPSAIAADFSSNNAPITPSKEELRDKTRLSPSKPIAILKRTAKAVSKGSTANSSGVLSDSTAESDGDLSVFDSAVPSKSALSYVPSEVARIDQVELLTPPSSCEEDSTLSAYTPKAKKPAKDAPRYKTAVERKAGLVSKLSKQFPDFTINPPSVFNASKKSSVHVFVDASNISIGLHDSYKIQHGIPVTTHIKRLPLSFYNFSLILERGRSVAKKVLAGSDRFAAINEAEKLGYEVNILSRVHKAKEYTPRQLKFRNALGPGGSSETGSSSERWVEQCVDEILHLKMLESLIDTDEPATIVLATGDAAEAEYSGGFLRMVERALQKGWSVEVVSFAMNTSFAYKRKEFRAKWGERFRMINLEDYVEEMLDM
ncbi:hypothetical protein DPV78_001661 [Talaromyces pinophilus]|nr:hypothetical protein DPV78_001661 [Talaromyces pinophilus]